MLEGARDGGGEFALLEDGDGGHGADDVETERVDAAVDGPRRRQVRRRRHERRCGLVLVLVARRRRRRPVHEGQAEVSVDGGVGDLTQHVVLGRACLWHVSPYPTSNVSRILSSDCELLDG